MNKKIYYIEESIGHVEVCDNKKEWENIYAIIGFGYDVALKLILDNVCI